MPLSAIVNLEFFSRQVIFLLRMNHTKPALRLIDMIFKNGRQLYERLFRLFDRFQGNSAYLRGIVRPFLVDAHKNAE